MSEHEDGNSNDCIEKIGTEVTILLVEANAAARQRLSRYFANIGCIVFECETLAQAEAVMSAHGEVIDHFVYDLVGTEAA